MCPLPTACEHRFVETCVLLATHRAQFGETGVLLATRHALIDRSPQMLSRGIEMPAVLQHCSALASLHLLHPASARRQCSKCSSHSGSAAKPTLQASPYCSTAACTGISKPLRQRDVERYTLQLLIQAPHLVTARQASINLSAGKQQT